MRRSLPAFRRVAFLLLLVACGSRTGLFSDDDGLGPNPDLDGGPGTRGDGSADGSSSDAIPPLDARPPTDVDRTDCPDAEATLIYTITTSYDLQSFNPGNGQFRTIGRITCPVSDPSAANTPFSMAVDRKGVAYVLFRDMRLYRVSTATGACIATSYAPRQANFALFGMGFATNSIGPTETLYVAGDDQLPLNSNLRGATGLARITPGTFNLTFVNAFTSIDRAEFTGTGDGRLYAFYRKDANDGPPSFIGEVDTATARVVGEKRFDLVDQGSAWAFAFWAGDFYMFHAPGPNNDRNPTRVTRWRPSDDSVTQVATTAQQIVGAGVSTCAPQQ